MSALSVQRSPSVFWINTTSPTARKCGLKAGELSMANSRKRERPSGSRSQAIRPVAVSRASRQRVPKQAMNREPANDPPANDCFSGASNCQRTLPSAAFSDTTDESPHAIQWPSSSSARTIRTGVFNSAFQRGLTRSVGQHQIAVPSQTSIVFPSARFCSMGQAPGVNARAVPNVTSGRGQSQVGAADCLRSTFRNAGTGSAVERVCIGAGVSFGSRT